MKWGICLFSNFLCCKTYRKLDLLYQLVYVRICYFSLQNRLRTYCGIKIKVINICALFVCSFMILYPSMHFTLSISSLVSYEIASFWNGRLFNPSQNMTGVIVVNRGVWAAAGVNISCGHDTDQTH